MKAILKHLKKFRWLILLFVLFIAAQAIANLSLPRITSDIVNVGIQQGGVESPVPGVIRAEEMEKLLLLTDAEQARQIASAYTSDGEGLLRLSEQGLSAEQEEALLLPQTVLHYLHSGGEQAAEIERVLSENFPSYASFKGEAADFPATLGAEQLALLREKLAAQFASFEESELRQTAIAFVQDENTACAVDTDALRNRYILSMGLRMLLLVFLIAVCAICGNYCVSRFGAGFSRELRSSVFRKVMRFSHKELGKLSGATLITRSTNDIQQIQMMISMGMRSVVFSPIMGFGSLYMMIKMDVGMAWVAAVALFGILLLIFSIMYITMPKFKILQNLIDRVNQVAREALSGIPVVRAFSRERFENERFDVANTELMRTNLFVARTMSAMGPTMSLIMNGVCVLIMWVGAGLVENGSSQVGDLLAYIQYAMHIVFSFMFLSMISIQLPRAIISIRRVGEILDMPISVQDPEQPRSFPAGGKGTVEFEHVCFRYPNAEEDVLHDISFVARPGETTAFIGSTGSGKTTLINLLPRFFDISSGSIRIDGVDIREVSLHELRAKIGFVPQKGQLFTGTVASNIAYGDADIPMEKIREAAAVAQAADFIEAAPEGYEREISQGGTNVSGGQRQRLSIARAVSKDPDIYIFDDSFSALDFKTDAALRKALARHTADATVLIVAQRISTVLSAEQIIVLDEGRIVGVGTHEQLMRDCPVYYQIAVSQLNEEELRA